MVRSDNLLEKLKVLIPATRESLRDSMLTTFDVDEGAFDTTPIEAALVPWAKRRQEIATNRDLSEEGRRKATRAEDAKLAAVVAEWNRRHVDGLRTSRDGQLRLSMKAVSQPEPTDPVSLLRRDLREAEIRRQLGEIDPVMVPLVYEMGGDEVRGALKRAPARITTTKDGGVAVTPLIPDQVVARVDLERADAASPETAATIRDLDALIEAHRGIAGTILATLREDGPLDGDPLD